MIDSWAQWWEARYADEPVGLTRRFRSVFDCAQKRLARSRRKPDPARRYIAVTTRKYRARRRR